MKAQDIRTTLTELRHLYRRIQRRALDVEDFAVFGAFVSKEIVRAERRQAKMLAKLAEEPEPMSGGELAGPMIDAETTSAETQEVDAGPTSADGAGAGDSSCSGSTETLEL